MIVKEQISSLLLEACPSFKAVYEESDDKDMEYAIAGDFARHLLILYQRNETSDFPAVANLIEEFHVNGDSYTKEYATIGILEGIQNIWGNNNVAPENFISFLSPVSKKYWQSLNDFWNGKVSYVGTGIDEA